MALHADNAVSGVVNFVKGSCKGGSYYIVFSRTSIIQQCIAEDCYSNVVRLTA